jgi:hypothetical protein
MRCIFCKNPSGESTSKEHIVPESMGNFEHMLPPGAVCDGCNQYFARKIERPLLESPMFKHLRFGMKVPNKRGRVPSWHFSEGFSKPSYRLMGRFLGKVGLESLAFKTQRVEEWNKEIVDQSALNDLRQFVRYNKGEDWPFTTRTIHPVNAVFAEAGQLYELLHEFDLLMTTGSEIYSVFSLFGVEFVINLGGRELDGFRKWLEENQFASPLYIGRNSSTCT